MKLVKVAESGLIQTDRVAKILAIAGSQDEKPWGGKSFMRNIDIDNKFEEGRILGHAQERQKFEEYFHGMIAPDLMAVAFSIESIRARLEAEGHPIELELQQIEIRISEILTQVREGILSEGGKA